jgi:hypothetical protein
MKWHSHLYRRREERGGATVRRGAEGHGTHREQVGTRGIGNAEAALRRGEGRREKHAHGNATIARSAPSPVASGHAGGHVQLVAEEHGGFQFSVFSFSVQSMMYDVLRTYLSAIWVAGYPTAGRACSPSPRFSAAMHEIFPLAADFIVQKGSTLKTLL